MKLYYEDTVIEMSCLTWLRLLFFFNIEMRIRCWIKGWDYQACLRKLEWLARAGKF